KAAAPIAPLTLAVTVMALRDTDERPLPLSVQDSLLTRAVRRLARLPASATRSAPQPPPGGAGCARRAGRSPGRRTRCRWDAVALGVAGLAGVRRHRRHHLRRLGRAGAEGVVVAWGCRRVAGVAAGGCGAAGPSGVLLRVLP